MTLRLDGNVLVALALRGHVHHGPVHDWWRARPQGSFATCPITQGTLLRLAMMQGNSLADASGLLHGIRALPDHEFWPDELPYSDVPMSGVIGHRQVTDAYLAQLARARGGQLATLDAGLAALHPDVAVAVPR